MRLDTGGYLQNYPTRYLKNIKNTFFPSADTIKLLVTKLHCHKSLVICN